MARSPNGTAAGNGAATNTPHWGPVVWCTTTAALHRGPAICFSDVGSAHDADWVRVDARRVDARWTSSAPLIATVSVTGLVTALAEGTAIIRATSGPQSGTSTITAVKR